MNFLEDIGLTPAEARHVIATNPSFVHAELHSMTVDLLKDELNLSSREVAKVIFYGRRLSLSAGRS